MTSLVSSDESFEQSLNVRKAFQSCSECSSSLKRFIPREANVFTQFYANLREPPIPDLHPDQERIGRESMLCRLANNHLNHCVANYSSLPLHFPGINRGDAISLLRRVGALGEPHAYLDSCLCSHLQSSCSMGIPANKDLSCPENGEPGSNVMEESDQQVERHDSPMTVMEEGR
jgi:hypothetical protein